MKDDSKCPKQILCNFVKVRDYADAKVERCAFCGKKVIYNISKNGRIDDKKYLRDHRRQTLQPTNRLFYKVFGKEPVERVKNIGNDIKPLSKQKEERAETQEYRRWIYDKMGYDKNKPLPRTKIKSGLQKEYKPDNNPKLA